MTREHCHVCEAVHETTPCGSCGEPIFFAKTARGKLMPLDAAVTCEKGGMLFSATDSKGEARRSGNVGHSSHFATCPDADFWRRRHA